MSPTTQAQHLPVPVRATGSTPRHRHPLICALLVLGAGLNPAVTQSPTKPWRLNDAVGGPDWLKLSGFQRTRIESIHNQPRPSKPLNDDQWFARTSLRADADWEAFDATLEVMDSRVYGGGSDAFASTAFTNTTDIIQGFGAFDLGQLGSGKQRLLAGRYTMTIGSRRFVIRNGYRNTVNTFTGVDYLWKNDDGAEVRAFWTMPVRRRPFDADSLRNNDFAWDDQNLNRQFSGVFTSRKLSERTIFDAVIFGKHDTDDRRARAEIYTPGFRLYRKGKRKELFAEFEVAGQFGKSQASAGGDTLDHEAMFVHASVGYTFDHETTPKIRLAWDYATGDRDPNDGENNRFDRLYGAPRFEYCPTGLYGVVQRSNLNTPELRVSIKPTPQSWLMLAYRDLRLAAARDGWIANGVRDNTGASGRQVGQQLELRLRYDFLPGNMFVETGGAYLFAGEFLDKASPRGNQDTTYGYLEMIWAF